MGRRRIEEDEDEGGEEEEKGDEEEVEEEEEEEMRLWVLGYWLEATRMCIGIARHASREPLEGSFETSWGPCWGFGNLFRAS